MRSIASLLLASAAVCAASVVPASAGTILVDDFCSGAQSLSGTGFQLREDPAGPAGPCPGALGGVRYLDYVATPGVGIPSVSLTINTSSTTALLTVDDALVNQLFIGWDGADTNSLTPGLGADLTAAGLNPEIVLFYLSDVNFSLSFIIRSGGADRVVNVTALATQGSVTVPLSSFAGLDPSAVEYIALRVANYGDTFVSGVRDTHLRLGGVAVFGTDPPPPTTPEPASAALLALGLAAAAGMRRSRRAR